MLRWAEAKDAFERSLELDDGNAEGWLGLGRVCMATGSEEDAEQHYARYVMFERAGGKTRPRWSGTSSCQGGAKVDVVAMA